MLRPPRHPERLQKLLRHQQTTATLSPSILYAAGYPIAPYVLLSSSGKVFRRIMFSIWRRASLLNFFIRRHIASRS